jgi:trk system potassium uptake protein TrkA
MYIVIAGGGIVGLSITKELAKKHDVVVIDQNEKNCEKISSLYGAVAIMGDATNLNVLKEAGIEKCDYALAVMDDDASNLLFSLLSKNFGVKNIFVRMRDPEYREAYEIAGATNIGHSVQMMAEKFVFDISNPEIRRIVSLRNGKADVSLVTVERGYDICGQSIREFASPDKFPPEVIIGGIFDLETDELIIPKGNTVVNAGNQMFLIGATEEIEKAYAVISKKTKKGIFAKK